MLEKINLKKKLSREEFKPQWLTLDADRRQRQVLGRTKVLSQIGEDTLQRTQICARGPFRKRRKEKQNQAFQEIAASKG